MSVEQQPISKTGATKINQNNPIDGQDLKELIEAGMTWLKTNQQTVNALNVFPVPDGDTGTNMVLTMQAAYNEVANSGEHNMGKMSHAVAQGALMGARGNSGVILSQLLRGFARGLDNLDTMNSTSLVSALVEGRKTAYKGVVRPVEGTILTVAKDVAAAGEAALAQTNSMVEILEKVVEAADQSVRRTPELLPVLKSAGVVDAGGKGLFYILEGILRYVKDQSLETPLVAVQPLAALDMTNSLEELEPGQDYEVVVDFTPNAPLDLDSFYNDLTQIGTSIQVGEGEGIYRMHIHVPKEKRDDPIKYTESLGIVKKVSMENLVAQMGDLQGSRAAHLNLTPVEPGQIAAVVVSPGLGISRIFASLGAAAIIPGGQTMNPSTEDILKALENLPTDKILILPNNKNIILTARTAASLTVKKVAVIPSASVPQGLSAMLRLAPDGELDEVAQEMTGALNDVETGEITTATRSVELNGVTVQKGQVIALLNGKLVYSASSLEEACLGLLARAETDGRERITLFYGDNIDKHEVNRVADKIRAAYPLQELEVHEGDQPHYQFIISIE
ncbi:MAG TPA: DAK2 domain-containing protein [Anaerolineaceae bacterium]|nr:DAK2 domain-containing protein [Anaerolineaceae bacterium]